VGKNIRHSNALIICRAVEALAGFYSRNPSSMPGQGPPALPRLAVPPLAVVSAAPICLTWPGPVPGRPTQSEIDMYCIVVATLVGRKPG
jgi:hypothetical protein